jgi:hypothetical protein
MIRAVETPEDVLGACDTSHLERILGELEARPENVRRLQGTIMLTFNVKAPVVCLEPRVKAFLRAAHQRIPHLWYYLVANPAYANLSMFFAVIGSPGTVSVDDDRFNVQPGEAELAYLIDRLAATARFAADVADDGPRILSEILAPMPPRTREALLAGALEIAGENQ